MKSDVRLRKSSPSRSAGPEPQGDTPAAILAAKGQLSYQRPAEEGAEDTITTGPFEEAQPYLQCNVSLLHGYRMNRSRPGFELTAVQCLKSIFMMSNEFGNIWSHTLAFMVAAGFALRIGLTPSWEGNRWFLVYLISVQACFLFSTLYHVFNCHSFWAWTNLLALDYAGIGCAFIGSSLLNLYPQFYCFPDLMTNYQIALAVIGFSVVIALLSPLNAEERGTKALVFRGTLVTTMMILTFAPTFHHRYLTGSFWFEAKWFMWWKMLLLFTIIVFTGVTYCLQWPESTAPGKFDHWLHSHQLMHLTTAVSSVLLFYINYEFYLFRIEEGCKIP